MVHASSVAALCTASFLASFEVYHFVSEHRLPFWAGGRDRLCDSFELQGTIGEQIFPLCPEVGTELVEVLKDPALRFLSRKAENLRLMWAEAAPLRMKSPHSFSTKLEDIIGKTRDLSAHLRSMERRMDVDLRSFPSRMETCASMMERTVMNAPFPSRSQIPWSTANAYGFEKAMRYSYVSSKAVHQESHSARRRAYLKSVPEVQVTRNGEVDVEENYLTASEKSALEERRRAKLVDLENERSKQARDKGCSSPGSTAPPSETSSSLLSAESGGDAFSLDEGGAAVTMHDFDAFPFIIHHS